MAITELTPGDHTGSCAKPVAYQATGVITRKAGTAATIKYHWVRDGQAGDEQTATFANGTATATLAWHHAGREEKAGTRHTVELRLTGGKGTATKTYTFTCKDAPEADVRIADLEVGAYNGSCTPPPQLTARAALQASQAGTVEYHWVVDGKASAGEKHTFTAPGQTRVDHVFTATRPGKVELVVDNYNKPRAAYDFHVTCNTNDPQPVVTVDRLASTAQGTGGLCPWNAQITTKLKADRAATVRYRWVHNGVRQPEQSVALAAGQSVEISRPVTLGKNGPLKMAVEVLSQNEPSAEADFPWSCHVAAADRLEVTPANYEGPCTRDGEPLTIRVGGNLRTTQARTIRYQVIDQNGVALHPEPFTYTFKSGGTAGFGVDIPRRTSLEGTVRIRFLEPDDGFVSMAVPIKRICRAN
ncbi:hypothetical protein ACIBG7_29305 [Nonomuraea sp. NPDC050328]|uniref:hypothetical protein n=1 Tax=Nonomuraea sp. NPDC050328 TaxID=3364361 RepID=UPI0037BAEB7F